MTARANELVLYSSKLPSNVELIQVNLDLEKYMEAAENLVQQAERAEIIDEATYATGGDLISIGRGQLKKAEADRTRLVGPLNKLVKFINGAYRLPKERFTDGRTIIEVKMLKWKRAEDEKLRIEADLQRQKIAAEALAAAEKEQEAEVQDEILTQAKDAMVLLKEEASVSLQHGDFGSSTGTKKTYSLEVFNLKIFLQSLIVHIDNGNKREIDLGALIETRKGGMNKLAERLFKAGVNNMPGAKVVETEGIRVY